MFTRNAWLKRNFRFDAGDPTTGDPAPAGDDSTPSPTPTSAVNDGDDDDPVITMSPAKLEERLQRERDKLAKELRETFLQELGVKDLDTAKAQIKAKRDADDAAKTEAEKLQEALDAATQQAQQAEQRVADMQRQQRESARDNAIKTAARKVGAVDDSDVLLNILSNSETLATLMDDDGNIQADAIAGAITTLQAAKPHLFTKQVPPTPTNRGGTPPQPTNSDAEKLKKTILAKRKKW